MEEIKLSIRTLEEEHEAEKIRIYLLGLASQEGAISDEKDKIDILVKDYKKGKIKSLDELTLIGEQMIRDRQGDH